MKSLGMVLLLSMTLYGDYITVMPYGGYLAYGADSIKDKGTFGGLYLSNSATTDKLELGYEQLSYSYKDANADSLKQYDMVVAYNRYVAEHFSLRGGLHYLRNSNVESTTRSIGRTQGKNSEDGTSEHTESTLICFGKIGYYKRYEHDTDINLYYSDYSTGLKLFQVTPGAGFGLGNYDAPSGRFYLRAAYIYIQPNRPENWGLKRGYHSVQLDLNHYKGPLSTTLSGWMGKQVFALHNEGFSVFNLNEEHQGGASLSMAYAIEQALSIKAAWHYERFIEEEGGPRTHSNVTSLSLHYGF